MAYLTRQDLIEGCSFRENDILIYHNKYYIVLEGVQNCKNCPLTDICKYVECVKGIFFNFKEISDIELLILKGCD